MADIYLRATNERNSLVKFVLLRSSVFVRNARKIIKKQPQLAQNIQQTLEKLGIDTFKARLINVKQAVKGYNCVLELNFSSTFTS